MATARNRRYKRADAPDGFQVAWQCPGVREICPANHLNQGGVYLKTQNSQPVGTTLKLKVPNPGGDIVVNSVVRSSTEKGMGVEFVAIGAKERAKLDVLVKRMLLSSQQEGTRKGEAPAKETQTKAPSSALQAAEVAFSEAAARKRRYIRINLPKGLKVAWTQGQHRELTIAGTIGLGGMFLISERPAEIGSTVRLLFDIPGGAVLATAVVRNQAPKRGMGVEFTEINPQDRSRLDQLLKRLLS